MNRRNIKAFASIFLVVAGALALYPLERQALAPRRRLRVRIGVIAPTREALYSYRPIFHFVEDDINDFCSELGYTARFRFILRHADGNATKHQEWVEWFHGRKIDLLIAGFWSFQALRSLDYVNDNDMLMFSPSSTYPLLEIAGDNLFRLSPSDTLQAEAIAEMLWSWGIEAPIVLQNNGTWFDYLYDALEQEFEGDIYARIKYEPDLSDLDTCLQWAEGNASNAILVYGKEHVAIELLSYSEVNETMVRAHELDPGPVYPNLSSIYWFGSSGFALDQNLVNTAPYEANRSKLFSTTEAQTESLLWDDLSERYFYETGNDLDFYKACAYDIGWIYAKAVLIARDWNTTYVKPVLADVSNGHFGATGWCHLNEYDDRYPLDYDIWGCNYTNGDVEWIRYGKYDKYTEEVTWYTDVLGFEPPGH